jgi:hypothetical protein
LPAYVSTAIRAIEEVLAATEQEGQEETDENA